MSPHTFPLRALLEHSEALIEHLISSKSESMSQEQKSKLNFNHAFIHDLRKMELQYPAVVSGNQITCRNGTKIECIEQNQNKLSASAFLDSYKNNYITQSEQIAALVGDTNDFGMHAMDTSRILQNYIERLMKQTGYIIDFNQLDTTEENIDPLYSDQLLGYLGIVKHSSKLEIKALAGVIERYIQATPIEIGVDEQGDVTIKNPPVNNLRRDANQMIARLRKQSEPEEGSPDNSMKQSTSRKGEAPPNIHDETRKEIIRIDTKAASASRSAVILKAVNSDQLSELFSEAKRRCPSMPESQRQLCESIITAICSLEHRRAKGMER